MSRDFKKQEEERKVRPEWNRRTFDDMLRLYYNAYFEFRSANQNLRRYINESSIRSSPTNRESLAVNEHASNENIRTQNRQLGSNRGSEAANQRVHESIINIIDELVRLRGENLESDSRLNDQGNSRKVFRSESERQNYRSSSTWGNERSEKQQEDRPRDRDPVVDLRFRNDIHISLSNREAANSSNPASTNNSGNVTQQINNHGSLPRVTRTFSQNPIINFGKMRWCEGSRSEHYSGNNESNNSQEENQKENLSTRLNQQQDRLNQRALVEHQENKNPYANDEALNHKNSNSNNWTRVDEDAKVESKTRYQNKTEVCQPERSLKKI